MALCQSTAAQAERIENPTAVFDGLDKITGRITTFDVPIDQMVRFGALQVTPRVCYNRSANERPQTDAFIEVNELTLSNETKRVFTGWMFAASPGLHAVEHPVYDVWLIDCKGGQPKQLPAPLPDVAAAPVPVKPGRHGTPAQPPASDAAPADQGLPVD